MYSAHRTVSAIAALALVVPILSTPAYASERSKGIDIRYDSNTPDSKTSKLWLAYLIMRTSYHEEHKLPIPSSGEVIPTFDEEVFARRAAITAYRTFRQEDGLRDRYWQTVSEVEAMGFLEPYVWSFHHRAQWNTKPPPKLRDFSLWRRSHLKDHVPQIYGWLEAHSDRS